MTPEQVHAGARVTGIILIALLHLILAWDVFASIKWGPEATVSWVVNGWIRQYPLLAFSIGLVIGHIVWPLR